MKQIVKIFKALSDETRLKILIILSKRKICAKGMAKHLNISEAAVSQHIKILKDSGIIVGEKVGYYVLYHLQEEKFSEIVEFIQQVKNNSFNKEDSLWLKVPGNCRTTCKLNKNRCCQK
ncbi:ArsR/SmtB family transcription factor [Caproiciproducens sp. MSJ-32]|uniref:ArsR/SmtB family transcription factor n=1 Tax=Caproiciproducens sp. MSJ-32 TaxID=2841527 RepID=UPI001C118BB0|nr:metalloregulator ArsR/SmtB family transcription factor [Caproiciproducens sp. MSJ-32]MBU5455005.1 metalloregulator ArsR/SmtB family transcription factor [Caproiciproducens sp. MSJ-32]